MLARECDPKPVSSGNDQDLSDTSSETTKVGVYTAEEKKGHMEFNPFETEGNDANALCEDCSYGKKCYSCQIDDYYAGKSICPMVRVVNQEDKWNSDTEESDSSKETEESDEEIDGW